jgi:hypothetical protein
MRESVNENAKEVITYSIEPAESLTSNQARVAINDIVQESVDSAAQAKRHLGTDFAETAERERQQSLIGECIHAKHPTLQGRVLVRWTTLDGECQERWLPTLQNLAVRPNDRLLLINPGNWNELVVTGVIDGFAKRPGVDRQTAGYLELESDEALRVVDRNGEQLLEMFQTAEGTVVRLLTDDTSVEFPGKLRLAADTIELAAGAGPIKIRASDDVIVNGEMIHLN